MKRSSDVVVIGGGVIGCAVAYYLSKQGLRTTLLDLPKRGRATSASAGGLWPLGESVGLGCGVIFAKSLAKSTDKTLAKSNGGRLPRRFLDFAIQSNAMFPELAEELLELSGMDIELRRTSLLFLMYDEGDVAFAKPLWEECPCGRDLSEWVSPEQLAKAEPAIRRDLRGALRFQGDDQVNPYRLADAFRAAARRLGATLIPHVEATGIQTEKGRVRAVETTDSIIPCGWVVNAAGAWAPEIGRMVGIDIPVRPIRGQILGTETLPKVLDACLSTTDCYLAQKAHGEIVIGSTTEDVGYEVETTPAALRTLAAGAIRAVPFLGNVRVKRTWSGLRPGSPDELPILGPVESPSGYVNACGHFRTGILNAPLTGLLIAESIGGLPSSFPLEPFLLKRFSRASALS